MATGHADLTRAQGFRAINGQPVVRVAEQTLAAGSQIIATWDHLEPIVRSLIAKVKTAVESDEVSGPRALSLLQACGNVVAKLGSTGASLLRASEGQAKLALLLEAGTVNRPHPTAMTEKQMAALVIATAKQLAKDAGSCPVCTKTVPTVAENLDVPPPEAA